MVGKGKGEVRAPVTTEYSGPSLATSLYTLVCIFCGPGCSEATDNEYRSVQVKVSPLQPDDFGLAHPRSDCQNVERVELVSPRHSE
jgi:hypothetical protein